jgi:hypothetical protein
MLAGRKAAAGSRSLGDNRQHQTQYNTTSSILFFATLRVRAVAPEDALPEC